MTRSIATLCLVTLLGSGCARGPERDAGKTDGRVPEATMSDAPEAAPPPAQATGWATTPLGGGAGPVVVKEGPAPLVYLVESGGAFRVHDATDRKDVARADVPGRTILRVDARSGVVAGGETLLAGPLPADHRYVIYLDPQGPNYSRQGVFQPRPAGHD